jgi:hypothetical protein
MLRQHMILGGCFAPPVYNLGAVLYDSGCLVIHHVAIILRDGNAVLSEFVPVLQSLFKVSALISVESIKEISLRRYRERKTYQRNE